MRSVPLPGSARPAVRAPGAPPPGSPLGTQNPHCFGCGSEPASGLRLQLQAGDDVSASGQYTVSAAHQGAPGLAHGGLLSCALDESMAALFWLLEIPAVTGTLTTEFRRPVPVGSRLLLTSRALGVDGRKIYTEAEARFADEPQGPVAVRASATFIQVDLDHFRRHEPPPADSADEVPRVSP